jgi:hypothetical protein
MEFLITESQLQTILLEQNDSKLTSNMKQLFSFTNNMVNKVIKNYGLNVKMLLTWGTSVGGLVMPLDNLIKNGNFDLSDKERALVLVGIAFTMFFENKRGIVSIVKKIKEEGLTDVFTTVLKRAELLKKSFTRFLNSCSITSGAVLDTVAYSFLIPIITDIHSIATQTTNISEASLLIAERLVASGVVILSKEILSVTLKKIMKKFK